MKIIVCMKQVPDTTEIKIDPATNTLIRAGVPSIVNPFDLNALEEAIRLREKFGGEITVICMGPNQAVEALRECYAIGADRMVLITDRLFGGSDTLATSYILSTAIKYLGDFDLILCGKQAIDGDTAQVGPEIAEHLGIPQITYASKVEIDGKTLRVTKEQESYYEVLETTLPALLTAVKSLNEPRHPNIMRKLRANKIEPEIITVEQLSDINRGMIGLKGSPTRVVKTFVPTVNANGIIISDPIPSDAVSKLFEHLDNAKIRLL